eukprot:TRINITY_DN1534_c0_g1_i1.p1 TRINITY_DN1534_c0_g1~~TRINITY_DN1534_c0_g1_i1.p1  ORF type:complete len:420 (+),score=69.92 TRINITY_DN1534_c0_g1_i1:576-1835(+)
MEIMSSQITSLSVVREKMRPEEPQVEHKAPVQVVDKTPLVAQLEDRVVKVESQLSIEVETLKAEMKKKIREVETRMEEIKVEETAVSKEEMERITKLLTSKPENENVGIEGLGEELKDDKAVELYKRYVTMNKELERFKQLVIKGYKDSKKEEGLEGKYKTYEKRISDLEKAKLALESEVGELMKQQEELVVGLGKIQKSVVDATKVKVSKDTTSADMTKKPPVDTPPQIVTATSSNQFFKSDDQTTTKRSKPSQKNLLSVGQGPDPKEREEGSKNLEERISKLWKEVNRCASKDVIEKLENSIKLLHNMMPNKVDKAKLDSVHCEIKGQLHSIREDIQRMKAEAEESQKVVKEVEYGHKEVKELIDEFGAKVLLLQVILNSSQNPTVSSQTRSLLLKTSQPSWSNVQVALKSQSSSSL